MRTRHVILFCSLAVLTIYFMFLWCEVAREPDLPKSRQLVITPAAFDLGLITQGSVISRDFLVRNESTEVVYIDKVIVSCGCTTVDLAAQRLELGESVTMKVTFDSKGFAGAIQKQVVLVTKGSNSSPAVATVFAKVIQEGLRIDSTRVELGSLRFGEKVNRIIHLLGAVPDASAISLVGSSNISLAWKHEVEHDDGLNSRPISVVVGPISDPPGEYQHEAQINLGHGLTIPVAVCYRVVPMVWAEPPSLLLNKSDWQGLIKLQRFDGTLPMIASITSKKNLLSLQIHQGEQTFREVVVSPKSELVGAKLFHDTIVVRYWIDADRKHTEELQMPVFFKPF